GHDNKPVPVPVFDTATGQRVADACPEGKTVGAVRFLPGGATLVLLYEEPALPAQGPVGERKIGIYSLQEKKLLRTASVDRMATTIAVAPAGKLIAVGNARWDVQLFDTETAQETGRLPSTFSLTTLAFSPDGRWLAAGRAFSGAITVWNVVTREYHPHSAEPV